jgi:hypothetical protein
MTKQLHRTIVTISGSIYPREELHYITKRKIQNPKPTERPILDFRDQDLVDDTPNEKLPLLIRSICHRQPQSFLDIGGSGELMRYHVRRAIY